MFTSYLIEIVFYLYLIQIRFYIYLTRIFVIVLFNIAQINNLQKKMYKTGIYKKINIASISLKLLTISICKSFK